MLTLDTMRNELLPVSALAATKASKTLTVKDLPNGVFIGIALSGGGSRAANFSTAALLELQKLGILQKTAIISSVSGSSLVAGYYGLNGNDPDKWNPLNLREQFRKDFELPWMLRWLNPLNIARYWFTNFNRSDIMRQELDSALFEEKQFKDMSPGLPRIFINATSYTTGQQFVFSDEQFKFNLNSRLDTYPLSNAVMASSSFPVVFHDITLKDYRIQDQSLPGKQYNHETENYEHLIDGGPSDNLGVTQLVDVVDSLYKQVQKPKACFLIVVDASPYQESLDNIQQADTRHWYDFVLDTNVATSSDVLLSTRRIDLLRDLGIDATAKDLKPYIAYDVSKTSNENHPCSVWHLTFQRLYAPSFESSVQLETPDQQRLLRQIRKVVDATPTRYKLTEVMGYSPESVQDYLFKAANILIHKDKISVKEGDKLLVTDLCERMGKYIENPDCHAE